MRARDLSFWRQKAAEYSLSAAKQCSAVKYNSFWPYGHTSITVPCNLRVVRQRARQHSAAVEGAVGIAQEEAAEWAHGMAIHARTVAAIAAGLTAVAAHGAATAQVNGELAAADEEARLTQ